MSTDKDLEAANQALAHASQAYRKALYDAKAGRLPRQELDRVRLAFDKANAAAGRALHAHQMDQWASKPAPPPRLPPPPMSGGEDPLTFLRRMQASQPKREKLG